MIRRIIKLFVFVFGLQLLFVSCLIREGCTDENAANYDAEVEDDDGSCVYPPRIISFYTTSSIGGQIHVELSRTQGDLNSSYGSYYGSSYSTGLPSSTGTDFNFDPTDENYPSCGLPNLGEFQRFTASTYYYDAFDIHGNVWSGTVSAQPGDCKLIEINRDSSKYGKLVLFTNQSLTGSNEYLNIILNPHTTSEVNNKRTSRLSLVNLYSPSTPTCYMATSTNSLQAIAGTVDFILMYKSKSIKVSLAIKGGDCTFYDVTPLIL